MTGNSATTESDVVSVLDSFVLAESPELPQLDKTPSVNATPNKLWSFFVVFFAIPLLYQF